MGGFECFKVENLMATLKSFEELEIWQRARELSVQIYEICSNGSLKRDFALRDQIRRSSGSVMDNIAEGFERSGNKEFIHFLSIAKGSAGEVKSQLYRILDAGHISQDRFNELYDNTTEISVKITRLMQYLSNSSIKGNKFKTNINTKPPTES